MIWQLTTTFTSIDELEDFCNYIKSHNPDGQVIRTESTIRKAAKAKEQQKADLSEGCDELPEELKADPAEIFDEPAAEAQKPEEKAPPIAFEDLRAFLTQLARGGLNTEIQGIIKSHGARKLSEIDPAEYDSVFKEAKELSA